MFHSPLPKPEFDKVRRLFCEQSCDKTIMFFLFCFVYLDVIIFTLVRGFHAEVGEVEFDPVAVWDSDVPHYALVVGVWLGEVGGGEAAI